MIRLGWFARSSRTTVMFRSKGRTGPSYFYYTDHTGPPVAAPCADWPSQWIELRTLRYGMLPSLAVTMLQRTFQLNDGMQRVLFIYNTGVQRTSGLPHTVDAALKSGLCAHTILTSWPHKRAHYFRELRVFIWLLIPQFGCRLLLTLFANESA